MALTPHNDPQSETTPSASSSSNGSTAVPSPEPVSSPPPTLSHADTQMVLPQERPNVLYRLFHPPTPMPLVARGVIVYALWDRPPIIPASLASFHSEMKQDGDSFGSWYMIRCLWQLGSTPTSKPIDESEAINALTTMVNYVDALAEAQANGQGNDSGAQLVYQLLQIQEIKVSVPRFYRLREFRPHYHISKEEMQQGNVNRRRGFVDILQEQFHLRGEDMYLDLVPPSTFGHYNQDTHSKGWIVLNPERALLIGVDTSSLHIFAGLVQRRDIDQAKQQKGIALDRYDDVLGRLRLWNAAQDIKETVDQLADLASSGQKATDGVVLLSLALAIIGILVAVYSLLHFSALQLRGTFGLLALASILFWRYAHNGKTYWLFLGLLSIVCALLLDILPI